jgi:hypothetical protein
MQDIHYDFVFKMEPEIKITKIKFREKLIKILTCVDVSYTERRVL